MTLRNLLAQPEFAQLIRHHEDDEADYLFKNALMQVAADESLQGMDQRLS